MYINQKMYCYEGKEYSFQEIENRLKDICNLNKADRWIYPDLTTKPVSTVAKIIRYIKSPLTFLANRFSFFQIATYPLNSLVSRIHKWNGIDIEKSKLFLADVKKTVRISFDPSKKMLVDQAIGKFNLSFPKHLLTHQIHLPLLDTDKEFDLRIFEKKLDDNAPYFGANKVLINDKYKMPRTLYHLFFIYFALKNGNDKKIYPLLKYLIPMEDSLAMDLERFKRLNSSNHKETIEKLNSDIFFLLEEKKLLLDQLTWKDTKILVDGICREFETLLKDVLANNNPHYEEESRQDNLFYHFYKFCFKTTDCGAHFKEITLRALELEWSLPLDTEVLYRAAKISKDDIIGEKNRSHSLSFANSLYSGLVFEGTPNGTCAYVYYDNWSDRQLYALSLSSSKLKKFFFYPELFKHHALLPLVAQGEFSHPRLRVFQDEKTTTIGGAQSRIAQVQALATYIPDLKIKNLEDYRRKIVTLFQRNIYLLGSNTLK